MKKIKRLLALILILCTAMGSCSCGKDTENAAERFSAVFYDSFDTVIQLLAYCGSEEEFNKLSAEVHDLFLYYHQLFDIYDNYEGLNNVKTINDNAGQQAVEVPEELIRLLQFGISEYKQTDGHVNIAFGSVLKLWHDARESAENDPAGAYVPKMEDLTSANKHTNIDDVIIDGSAGTVFLEDPEMSLDLGAIAKGYATELILDKLTAEGYDNIMISAGGNTKSIGTKPDGANWVVAVENPDKTAEAYAKVLEVSGMSVVTSGTYERFFDYEGVRYHHIINKDSLKPENKYLSVTIITEDSGMADALSTAVFNMDIDDGLNFVNSFEGVYAMWIRDDYSCVYSEGFEKYIKLGQ